MTAVLAVRPMMRTLWPWLRLLIAVGILATLVWRLGTEAFVTGLRVIDGRAILAALAIGLLTTVLSAWRWCIVARRLGLRLPLATAIADYYRSQFLNAVLPAGVLGDVHRAVRHGKDEGDVGRGIRAVALERTAGQVVLYVVGAGVLLLQPSLIATAGRYLEPSGSAVAIGVAVLATLAVAAAALAWRRWGRGRSASAAHGGPEGRDGAGRTAKWRRGLATAVADARRGLFARDVLPGVAILSAAVVAGHLATFLLAARVAGFTAPYAQLIPLMVLALVVMGLPVNVGGWGPREAFSALAFGVAGLGATQGLATAVVYGVLTFVAALPGAWVLVLNVTQRRPRPRTRPRARLGIDNRKVVTE